MKRGAIRFFSACLVLSILSACGSGASTGVPAAPRAGSSRVASPAENTPAGELTIAAELPPNIRVKAYFDNGELSLPARVRPGFSRQPHSVLFTASGGGLETSYAYSVQTGYRPMEMYYNPLRDASGSIGSIVAAGAFARRPASLLVLRRALEQPAAAAIVPDQLYVTYDRSALRQAGSDPGALETRSGVVAMGTDLLSADPSRILRSITLPRGVSAARAAAALRALPGVVAVDPVHYAHLYGSAYPFYPNNPGFEAGAQWYLKAIQAPYAWTLTHGSSNVCIAVIDTGADSGNVGLRGKLISGELVVKGVVTRGLGASQDYNGHGTNVSGIAASATNNGAGFAGTAFDVRLREYKVFPGASPIAMFSDVAKGIEDAVADGCRVANMSLGAEPQNGTDVGIWNAVEAATASGMTVVAAAGNSSLPVVGTPANLPGVISVGADALDDRANPPFEYVSSYSNYGPDLTLVAPGGDTRPFPGSQSPDHGIDNIYTTTPNSNPRCTQDPSAYTGCGYRILQGTSMASPVVAGVAALMLSVNPNLTREEIKRILTSTADDIGDPDEGAGRVDAYRAVAAAAGVASPVTPPARNFVAIAYTVVAGSNEPRIIDRTYTGGVRLGSNGLFRLPDVPPSPASYSVGVWFDANGDRKVDKGDWFGSVGCVQTGFSLTDCRAGGISVRPVPDGFILR